MDGGLPGQNGPRSVTNLEFRRIVLTVSYAILNPGRSSFSELVPISPFSFWSVRVSFDTERFADRIKNTRVNSPQQVADQLAHLSLFYTQENGRVHGEPMVVVDCHGRILLWYLPEVLSRVRLVRINSP
jgi:hypothetical protein